MFAASLQQSSASPGGLLGTDCTTIAPKKVIWGKEKRALDFPPEFTTRAFFLIRQLCHVRLISPRRSDRIALASISESVPAEAETAGEQFQVGAFFRKRKEFQGPKSAITKINRRYG
jgi:hypothetical protein